jgi:hypothetical protein
MDRQLQMWTVTVVVKIGLSGTKMMKTSVQYHFMPHLVMDHIEMDNACFSEEVADETIRYASEAIPVGRHSVWVRC